LCEKLWTPRSSNPSQLKINQTYILKLLCEYYSGDALTDAFFEAEIEDNDDSKEGKTTEDKTNPLLDRLPSKRQEDNQNLVSLVSCDLTEEGFEVINFHIPVYMTRRVNTEKGEVDQTNESGSDHEPEKAQDLGHKRLAYSKVEDKANKKGASEASEDTLEPVRMDFMNFRAWDKVQAALAKVIGLDAVYFEGASGQKLTGRLQRDTGMIHNAVTHSRALLLGYTIEQYNGDPCIVANGSSYHPIGQVTLTFHFVNFRNKQPWQVEFLVFPDRAPFDICLGRRFLYSKRLLNAEAVSNQLPIGSLVEIPDIVSSTFFRAKFR
jgi:hypothetical protein